MELEKKINQVAKRFGIKYAIIFGSFVEKRMHKESDIDLAIKLKKFEEKNAYEIIKSIVSTLDVENLDLVIINHAPFSLLYDIFTKGKLIYCENKDEFYRDAYKIIKLYDDWKTIALRFEKREIEKVMK